MDQNLAAWWWRCLRKLWNCECPHNFTSKSALFHACEGDFRLDGQFSHMTMPKKPQPFAHCKQRAKSSLVVETSEKVLCVDIRMSTMSTMLFSMPVRVSFALMANFPTWPCQRSLWHLLTASRGQNQAWLWTCV